MKVKETHIKWYLLKIYKTIRWEFSWKILWIRILVFIFILIFLENIKNWESQQYIFTTLDYSWKAIHFLLWVIPLLVLIKILLLWIEYFVSMVVKNIDIKWYINEKKSFFYSLISWLLQYSISRFIITFSFEVVSKIDIPIYNNIWRDSYIAMLLLLMLCSYWFINIIFGFFEIKGKPYRVNYFIWPSILISIMIIYLNIL